ncbi:MAG: glycosyltransferase, partial [Ignavibacteria bacterium]|nr:glycosyltransferase [Ignavibacteria bacterium]
QYGWNPVVLTVKEPYDFYRDEEMMTDVLGKCVIARTYSIEPMKWVRKFLKKRSQAKIQTDSARSINEKSLKPGILVKLKTYILFPDNEILWLPFAVLKGIQLIKKYKLDLIYSTASPFTDHLIALILVKFSNLSWVADFRDLWVDRPNFPKNRWRLFIDRKLEKMVIKNADHIITATPVMAEHFSKLYPNNNYSSITNGFDEDDFSNTSGIEPVEDKFLITYTGIFNKEQNPQKFFMAVHKAINKRDDFKEKVKLKIIGQLDNPGDFENMIYFKKLGLDKYSELIPYLPHKQVTNEMCRSTVLLLLVGEYPYNEGILTGKIFEYLRAGRPILAVVPPNGLAADVIKETNSGQIVSNESVEKISNGILALFDMFISNILEGSFKRVGIEKFNRQSLTKELSEVFEQTVHHKLITKNNYNK